MKLLTYTYQGNTTVGVYSDKTHKVYSFSALGYDYQDMNEVIEKLGEGEKENIHKKLLLLEDSSDQKGIVLENVILNAPIPRPKQDVVCLGLNYDEHQKESNRFLKAEDAKERKEAVYFSKRVTKAVAPNGKILSHSDIVKDLDYEVELAVILGKDAYQVKASEAKDYVFGYTILNDVSARTLQKSHGQWYFGKSLDGFTPMGPWIVTSDEISYPPALEIRCEINGELRQHSNTSNMISDINYILAELTAGMTLEAGTIIATGTPAGVGIACTPPKPLKPGDQVDCFIQGIGLLHNEVE